MGENSSGFTNEQSPQGGAFNRDLLDQKSKPELFPGPGGGGAWLQMTGALCSNMHEVHPQILIEVNEI